MKVKLGRIKLIEESLGKLIKTDIDIKIAYKLSRFLKQVVAESTLLEESRIKLVQKYSCNPEDEKEKGKTSVDPAKQQEFFQEYGKLLEEKTDIDFSLIPVEEFRDIKLSALDILNLEGIVFEPTEESVSETEEQPENEKDTEKEEE